MQINKTMTSMEGKNKQKMNRKNKDVNRRKQITTTKDTQITKYNYIIQISQKCPSVPSPKQQLRTYQ